MSEKFRKLPISLGEHEIVRRGNVTLIPGSTKTTAGTTNNAPGDSTTTKLATPQNLAVESQTVHIGQHGEEFVDVVIEWDAVSGAKDYHIRIRAVNA